MAEEKKFETPADLLKELNEMKGQLETSLAEKAGKNIDEKLTAVNASIEEIKAATKTKEDTDKLTADKLKEMSDNLAITVKALDVLQTRVKSQNIAPVAAPKTFGQSLKDAFEDATDNVQKFLRKETKQLNVEVKAVADQSTANVTGGVVYGAQYKPGIIANPNQINHMREFFTPVAAGPGTDVYFMRENGVGEGAPAPTSEKQSVAATTQATGLKPQFDIDLIESSVKFETIAGFMTVSRKAMQNIPNFLQFLNLRVPEKLLDVEDAQILYGNGTSPNLKGILTSGNFVAGSAAGTTALAVKIINDLAAFEDVQKRVANGIWLRPVDFWAFFKATASGSGEFDLPQNFVFQNGQLFVSGVPVYKTTALTTNDYFIGDKMGAELLVQENITMRFFEEDGTNVRTNQLTLRIEETIALPVYGSNYFIKGSSALA